MVGADRVAVWAEPRLETVVAALGALAAGVALRRFVSGRPGRLARVPSRLAQGWPARGLNGEAAMRNRDSGRSSATYCHQDDATHETADSEDGEHDAGPLKHGMALGIKDLATTEQRVLEGRLVLRGRGQADTADEDADHPGDEDEHAEATVFRWRKIEAPARRSVSRHPERAGYPTRRSTTADRVG